MNVACNRSKRIQVGLTHEACMKVDESAKAMDLSRSEWAALVLCRVANMSEKQQRKLIGKLSLSRKDWHYNIRKGTWEKLR